MEKITEENNKKAKKEIIKLAIDDWGNEFCKILSNLELSQLKRKTDVLYSKSGERYAIKTFWERYPEFKQDFVLGLEKEYPELKEMRAAIEKSEKIMQDIYNFLEGNKDENSEEFWHQIHLFLDESKMQYEKFVVNKNKLIEKYEQ